MRVLTVLDAFRLGGAETLIAQLGRVASDVGLEMRVLSLHGYSDEHSTLAPLLEQAGLVPEYLGASRTVDVAAFVRLTQLIKSSGVDIVHAHLEMAMTQALPAARLAGIPSVGTFHHVYRPLHGRAAARERLAVEVATRSQAAIFVSQASLTSFKDRYRPRRPTPRSWTVVHNGVDLDYFSPGAADVVAAPPSGLDLEGKRVVTVLAALRDFKGIIHAVRAWPTVLARHAERPAPPGRVRLAGAVAAG